MDSLQQQVAGLNSRVDALHRIIEQLSDKTAEVLSEVRGTATSNYRTPVGVHLGRYASQGYSSADSAMEHKDILLDASYPDPEGQSGERALSPEIQIQRLTAQLTAAYNRIAALEEQLLAQRLH